jgi:hypothetical protein
VSRRSSREADPGALAEVERYHPKREGMTFTWRGRTAGIAGSSTERIGAPHVNYSTAVPASL